MFRGVAALLGRSLRLDSRSWQVHLARFGLMAAIYVSLILAVALSFRLGAPGLRFFRSILWLNITFMSLLGISFFSSAVSEVKEEDTLGLMQMAGINSLGILLGKVGGRLIQALLLICVQYPFTLLAVTMGGVTQNQIRCAFVGLIAYMLFLAGLGTLCSTIASRNRTAAALMILGMIVYVFGPLCAYDIQRVLVADQIIAASSWWAVFLRQLASVSLLMEVSEIMTSSFHESPWSLQVISNISMGVVFFFLSWLLFNRFASGVSAEATTRGLLTRKRGTFQWFSPGRPRWNPYVWKDFHFVGGGVSTMLIRICVYFAVVAAVFVLNEFWWGSQQGWRMHDEEAVAIIQIVALMIVSLDLALVMGKTFNDEIRGQTLASLVMLPESMSRVSYSKLTGAILAAAPGLMCLAAVSVGTVAGRRNLYEFFHESAGWFFLAHFVLVPHLAMALALEMRWGFIPVAIGLTIGSLFGWICFFESCRTGPSDGIVTLVAFLLFVVCGLTHFWVCRRILSVAARG